MYYKTFIAVAYGTIVTPLYELTSVDRKVLLTAVKSRVPPEILDQLCAAAIDHGTVSITDLRKVGVFVQFSYGYETFIIVH